MRTRRRRRVSEGRIGDSSVLKFAAQMADNIAKEAFNLRCSTKRIISRGLDKLLEASIISETPFHLFSTKKMGILLQKKEDKYVNTQSGFALNGPFIDNDVCNATNVVHFVTPLRNQLDVIRKRKLFVPDEKEKARQNKNEALQPHLSMNEIMVDNVGNVCDHLIHARIKCGREQAGQSEEPLFLHTADSDNDNVMQTSAFEKKDSNSNGTSGSFFSSQSMTPLSSSQDSLSVCLHELLDIPFDQLKAATNDFDSCPVKENGRLLGEGSFGNVYLGHLKQEDNSTLEVAVKKFKPPKRDNPSYLKLHRRQFPSEIQALSKCQHKNVVQLLAYSVDSTELCLVYECLMGGTLREALSKNNPHPPSWEDRLVIALDVSKALNFVHSVKFVHRDVKSANVLLGKDKRGNLIAKLTDFGLSSYLGEDESPSTTEFFDDVVGTKSYMSPEAMEGFLSPTVDVYAFGMIMYEIVTGLPPYSLAKKADLIAYIKDLENSGEDPTVLTDPRTPWPLTVAQRLFALSKTCTNEEPSERPQMKELCKKIKNVTHAHDNGSHDDGDKRPSESTGESSNDASEKNSADESHILRSSSSSQLEMREIARSSTLHVSEASLATSQEMPSKFSNEAEIGVEKAKEKKGEVSSDSRLSSVHATSQEMAGETAEENDESSSLQAAVSPIYDKAPLRTAAGAPDDHGNDSDDDSSERSCFFHESFSSQSKTHGISLSSVLLEYQDLLVWPQEIPFEELKAATDGFNTCPVNKKGCLLGSGSFGDVYLGHLQRRNIPFLVAVKKFKPPKGDTPSCLQLHRRQFPSEIQALSKCRHKNVVQLLAYSTDSAEQCIVYELLMDGTLRDALSKGNESSLSWKNRLVIALHISEALHFIHSFCNLVHRDVKSSNVLLGKDEKGLLIAKLADFGLSSYLDIGTDEEKPPGSFDATAVGTKVYMSPEAEKGRVSPTVDVYAFGMIMYEIITGLAPYISAKKGNLIMHMRELENAGEDPAFLIDSRTSWPPAFFRQLLAISKMCTSEEPSKRPKMEEICEKINDLVADASDEDERPSKSAGGNVDQKSHPETPSDELGRNSAERSRIFRSFLLSQSKTCGIALSSILQVDQNLLVWPHELSKIPFEKLKAASDGFNSSFVTKNGGSLLGSGRFGDVYLGRLQWRDKLTVVAIKKFKPPKNNEPFYVKLYRKQFPSEMKTLSNCRHKNIVQLLGYSLDSDELCIVYELLMGGTLRDALSKENESPSWKDRLVIALHISEAVDFIHSHFSLVHRDVKSTNVLLGKDNKGLLIAKLADFGLSSKYDIGTDEEKPPGSCDATGPAGTECDATGPAGTECYMPHEAKTRRRVSPTDDVHAFAMVIYEIVTGLPPVIPGIPPQYVPTDLITHIKDMESAGENPAVLIDHRTPWPLTFARQLFALARKCKHYDSPKKPIMKEVCKEIQDLVDRAGKNCS
ncbi:uncharacterized protein [Oscarella lobularis]|uniref:uncharacterized protein isoform X2 n=1 Tax=Oscarella lobularis TaxID=121494 RepID=UPI0033140E77